MKVVKNETKKEEKKEFELQECFTLWIHESKNKVKYLTGYDFNKNKLVGFFNRKNKDNQPIIRIYPEVEENETAEEIITLWERKGKNGNLYLTGLTNEKENVVGFYGDENQEARPYIRGYFKKD